MVSSAEGRLAKTDRLDARLLVAFGQRLMPPPTPQADPTHQTLRDLLTRREQLIQMRTAERNRLQTAPPATRQSLQQHVEWLDKEIARLEKELQCHIDQTDECKQQQELLNGSLSSSAKFSGGDLAHLSLSTRQNSTAISNTILIKIYMNLH